MYNCKSFSYMDFEDFKIFVFIVDLCISWQRLLNKRCDLKHNLSLLTLSCILRSSLQLRYDLSGSLLLTCVVYYVRILMCHWVHWVRGLSFWCHCWSQQRLPFTSADAAGFVFLMAFLFIVSGCINVPITSHVLYFYHFVLNKSYLSQRVNLIQNYGMIMESYRLK